MSSKARRFNATGREDLARGLAQQVGVDAGELPGVLSGMTIAPTAFW